MQIEDQDTSGTRKVLLSLPAGTHATAAMYAVASATSMTRWLEELVIDQVHDADRFEEAMRTAKENFDSPTPSIPKTAPKSSSGRGTEIKKVVLSLPTGTHATAAMYAVAEGVSMTRWLEELVINQVHDSDRFEEAMRTAKENFNSVP